MNKKKQNQGAMDSFVTRIGTSSGTTLRPKLGHSRVLSEQLMRSAHSIEIESKVPLLYLSPIDKIIASNHGNNRGGVSGRGVSNNLRQLTSISQRDLLYGQNSDANESKLLSTSLDIMESHSKPQFDFSFDKISKNKKVKKTTQKMQIVNPLYSSPYAPISTTGVHRHHDGQPALAITSFQNSATASNSKEKIANLAHVAVLGLPLSYLRSRPDLRMYALEQACRSIFTLAILKAISHMRQAMKRWKRVIGEQDAAERKRQELKVGLMVLLEALSALLHAQVRRKFIWWCKCYSHRFEGFRYKIRVRSAQSIQRWYGKIRSKLLARKERKKLIITRALKKKIRAYKINEKKRLKEIEENRARTALVERKYVYYNARKIQRQYRHHELQALNQRKRAISIIFHWENYVHRAYPENVFLLHLIKSFGGFTKLKKRIPLKYQNMNLVEYMKYKLNFLQIYWKYNNPALIRKYNLMMLQKKMSKKLIRCYKCYKLWSNISDLIKQRKSKVIQRSIRSYIYRLRHFKYVEAKRNNKAKIIQRFIKFVNFSNTLTKRMLLKETISIIHKLIQRNKVILIQRAYRSYRNRHTTESERVIKLIMFFNNKVLLIQRNWSRYYKFQKSRYPRHVIRAVSNYYLREKRYYSRYCYKIQKLARAYLHKLYVQHQIMLNNKAKIIQKCIRTSLFRIHFKRKIEQRTHSHDLVILSRLQKQFQLWNKNLILWRGHKNNKAIKIQKWYRRWKEQYYSILRVAARNQLQKKRKELEKKKKEEMKQYSARKLQTWARNIHRWKRFKFRVEVEKQMQRKSNAQKLVKYTIDSYVIKKRYNKVKKEKKEKYEAQLLHSRQRHAAGLIGRTWRKYSRFRHLQHRFELRKNTLKDMKALDDARMAAENMRDDALYNASRIEENMDTTIATAWKQGSDANGKNYYYNYVTGESRWEAPENWKINVADQWIRNLDERQNAYYYNIKTGESRWLPPCNCCGEESLRWCFECSLPYCESDYEVAHGPNADPSMAKHTWSATEIAKDILKPGEVYCVECRRRVGAKMCMNCWDAFCDECFKYVHHVGTLKSHQSMPYRRAKKGWICIKARIEGESDYYVNGTTGETTYEKPEVLMTEEEKIYFQNFKQHRQAAEEHVKMIEKLQFELEAAKYERDTALYDSLARDKEGKHRKSIMMSLGLKSHQVSEHAAKVTEIAAAGGGKVVGSLFQGITNDYRKKLLTPTIRERSKMKTDYIESLLKDKK